MSGARPQADSAGPAVAPLLARLRAEPSRTGSLLITVFGDAIVPRGGSVWLGTLLRLCGAMGIGDGVVRTAVSRLAAEGWLERTRQGRNSFYRLSASGEARFAPALARVYGPHPSPSDDTLCVVLLPERDDGALAALRESGFGSPLPGVWIAPWGAPVPDRAIMLRAETGQAERLARLAWDLVRLDEAYGRFVATFARLDAAALSGLDALIARTLLVHEYRRVILRDPLLPPTMLPAGWSGTRARATCRQLYPALLPASERWLNENGVCESGPLPPPGPSLTRRFADEVAPL